MMVIIGAMNSPKSSLAEEIAIFGELSFDFVEITIEAPSATPERIAADKKRILDSLHSYNFGVLAHLPWYFSVAHPYPRVQEAINGEFCKAFDAAAALGAKKVTMHTEFLPAGVQERQVHVAKTIETAKLLEKEARERGLQLLVENYDQGSFSLKEFALLFAEVDIGLTLDIGHASLQEGEGVEGYIARFKKRISHVHLHDNDRKLDQHLPLGAGKIDVARAVKSLKAFYDGTITLEVHSRERGYLKMSKDALEILWYGRKHHEKNKEYQQPIA